MHPLKRSRLENDLTVRGLAARAGVATPTILKAERGSVITELSAFRLAKALGEDPEYFVELLSTDSAQKQPA